MVSVFVQRTSESPGQIAVVYHYCDLSRFFLTRKLCGKVEWFCLSWGINAKFTKKMADSLQLVLSLTLSTMYCTECLSLPHEATLNFLISEQTGINIYYLKNESIVELFSYFYKRHWRCGGNNKKDLSEHARLLGSIRGTMDFCREIHRV